MTARRYGRLTVTIGPEMADAGLSANARLLYMSLECQPKMSACGLLEIQDRRWARDTGLTRADIDAALAELDTVGWVLVDHDTFEVLSTRHVRDDIQLSNPKVVAGVWNSIDRIESPRLRQAAVEALPDNFPPRSGKRLPDRPGSSPDRSPDQSDSLPGDRPVTCYLLPVTSSSSSRTTTDATHLPVDDPVDDDDTASTPNDPTARARIACELIGDNDYERALADGQTPRSPTKYRSACHTQATTTWLTTATRVAENEPGWTPADIAQHLTATQLPPPQPPPTARAPAIDLRSLPIATNDRGAPIVDLETARQPTSSPGAPA